MLVSKKIHQTKLKHHNVQLFPLFWSMRTIKFCGIAALFGYLHGKQAPKFHETGESYSKKKANCQLPVISLSILNSSFLGTIRLHVERKSTTQPMSRPCLVFIRKSTACFFGYILVNFPRYEVACQANSYKNGF